MAASPLMPEIPVTICQPHPARTLLEDEPQFTRHVAPVTRATWDGSGRVDTSPHLGFDDYQRSMSSHRYAAQVHRKNTGYPTWAANDLQLRNVILLACAIRVTMGSDTGCKTLLAARRQLAAVTKAMAARAQGLIPTLEKRCKQYVAAKTAGELDAIAMAMQERNIKSLDTSIRIGMEGPRLLVKVLYFAYRLGMSSPNVAAECGLTACGVRQLLRKMNRAARVLGYQ